MDAPAEGWPAILHPPPQLAVSSPPKAALLPVLCGKRVGGLTRVGMHVACTQVRASVEERVKQAMSRALELEAQLAQHAVEHEQALHAAALAKAQVDQELATLQARQAALEQAAAHAEAAKTE